VILRAPSARPQNRKWRTRRNSLRRKDGKETADAYGLPPCPILHWRNFLPESVKQSDPSLANLDKIKVAPITGVHFWFDRPVMDEPFVTLLDTTTQWIFNKTALLRRFERKRKERSRWTIFATRHQRVL